MRDEGHVGPDCAATPRVSRSKFLRQAAMVPMALVAARHPLTNTLAAHSGDSTAATIRIDTTRVRNAFDPDQALGTSMDILPPGIVDKIYTPEMVKQCLSAGWGPITYRQNTELQIAAWHWNPNGSWSDPHNRSGYFTGSTELGEPIRHSYGYPLPHRGHTRNGGAEHGYSRLTDGDPATYWKSNPYLTSRFTGEDSRPQWVVIDLAHSELVNAIRIDWANPYARVYQVQYWTGADAMNKAAEGKWATFASGNINQGRGGSVLLKLEAAPVQARFIRIWMTESSNTPDSHAAEDPRNACGYAIHELAVGSLTDTGELVDLVQHRPDQQQTATYCSSIDPWHSVADLDQSAGDQTGVDLFFTSGITNGLPAMMPVSMLYGTPDDAAAQIAYLQRRGYAVSYIEMGEEPDGQFMLPEDYAALYLQFATAIHRVAPQAKLGGPVFEGVTEDIKAWPDERGRTSWLGRFIEYLSVRGRLGELSFVSFEHYPFDACDVTWADLFREPALTEQVLEAWRRDGANVPLFNTESNVAPALASQMADIFSALWLADSVGSFLNAGGAAYYHSPIQPEPLRPGCHGWSTYGNFVAGEDLVIQGYTAQYFASQLINLEWVQHRAGLHRMYLAACDLKDAAGHVLITAYAVHRPDGQWAVLAINKDQSNAHAVQVSFDDAGARTTFAGPVTAVSFGSAQYAWHSAGSASHAAPDGPPVKSISGPQAAMLLPKASVTVLRGKVGEI